MPTADSNSPQARVIDGAGNVTGSLELPSELSGRANDGLMHQVVTAQLAAARSGNASTKTRSEVRGGGAKPWRQKGTGRARHGSSRSPLWVGGGTVFGPKGRRYSVKVNKKMRRAALRSALGDKARAGRIWVLEDFTEHKTRAAASCLQKAGVEGRVLIVLDSSDTEAEAIDRAFRNLPAVAFSLYGSLGTYEVLVADSVLFTRSAFDRFTAWLQGSSNPSRVNAGQPDRLKAES